MSFEPTNEQKQAIECLQNHMGLTAGAGSGKTRVLVERFLNLLSSGVPLDAIIAITFTKKAAKEMKERISQSVLQHPSLSWLASRISEANISTIHSLCTKILKAFPREAEVCPRFRLAEEWESKALLRKSIAYVLEQVRAQGDGDFSSYTEEFKRISQLESALEGIYEQMASKGELFFDSPDKGEQEEVLLQAPLEDRILDFATLSVSSAIALRRETLLLAYEEAKPYLSSEESFFEGVFLLEEALKGNWGSKVKGFIDGIKEALQEVIGVQEDGRLLRYEKVVRRILREVHILFEEEKKARGILDYNDLERRALKVLKDPKVKETFLVQHLMVDEFQDTNQIQKNLVDALCSESTTLFIVGDPKQSIYRFRGAEVEVFAKSCEEIRAKGGVLLNLDSNFRSAPPILHFANHFFDALMSPEYIPSTPKRTGSGICVEFLPTDKEEKREGEARSLARRILELKEDNPSLNYRDFVFLFRSMTHVAVYEEALKKARIPYVNQSGRGFYGKQEVSDCLAFLSWVLDPENENLRFAVLRSPFFLVSDEALYFLSKGQSDSLGKRDQDILGEAKRVHKELQILARAVSGEEVLGHLLASTPFLQRISEQDYAEQKLANIDKLRDTAGLIAREGYYSLVEQLTYLESVTEDSKKEGEARLDLEEADVVRLMTIHGAKGLEFPVVLLPNLDGAFLKPNHAPLLYDKELGLALKGSTRYKQIKTHQEEKETAEAKRLLYVAITRAKEYLLLSAAEELGEKVELGEAKSFWHWLGSVLPKIPSALYFQGDRKDYPDKVAEEAAVYSPDETPVPLYPLEPIPPSFASKQFSVTSLMVFAECPRKYYFRYVVNLPEPKPKPRELKSGILTSLTPISRGTVLHRACEVLKEDRQMEEILDWSLQMEGVTPSEKDKKDLLRLLRRYVKSPYFQAESKREWEFLVSLHGHFLVGTIDQVIEEEDCIRVLDLKTNAITKKKVESTALQYEKQLLLYSLAVGKQEKKPVLAQLYFLLPNVVYTHPRWFRETELQAVEVWLKETMEAIVHGSLRGIDAFPKRESACTSCGYPCHLPYA